MKIEEKAAGGMAAAEGRIETARREIEARLAQGYVPGASAPATAADGSALAGVPAAIPQCKPEDIRWLVRLLWVGGWRVVAKGIYHVDLDAGLFPDDSTEAIAAAACPVVDRYAPWLHERIGPEGALIAAMIENGAAPYIALQEGLAARHESDEADGGWDPADE